MLAGWLARASVGSRRRRLPEWRRRDRLVAAARRRAHRSCSRCCRDIRERARRRPDLVGRARLGRRRRGDVLRRAARPDNSRLTTEARIGTSALARRACSPTRRATMPTACRASSRSSRHDTIYEAAHAPRRAARRGLPRILVRARGPLRCACASGGRAARSPPRVRTPSATAETRPASSCDRPRARSSSSIAEPARARSATSRWRSGPRPLRGHILISHTHWDHIQGLPFFAPLFVPGNEWDIYAPHGFEQSLQETLAGPDAVHVFPDHAARARRHHPLSRDRRGHLRRRRHPRHDAVSQSPRAHARLPPRSATASAVVYACDHEPHARQLAAGERRDRRAGPRAMPSSSPAPISSFTTRSTRPAEYESKKGWGHSTVEYAVEVAPQRGRAPARAHPPRSAARRRRGRSHRRRPSRRRVADSGSSMEVFARGRGRSSSFTPRRGRHAGAAHRRGLRGAVAALGAVRPHGAARRRRSGDGGAIAGSGAADGIRAIVETDGAARARQGAGRIARRWSSWTSTCRASTAPPSAARDSRPDGDGSAASLPIIVVADREKSAAAAATTASATGWSSRFRRPTCARGCARGCCAPPAAGRRRRCRRTKKDASRHCASLGVLDTPPEERFDRLTRLAAAIFDVPTVLVSLVDRDRQWFKSALRRRRARDTARHRPSARTPWRAARRWSFRMRCSTRGSPTTRW